MFGIKKAKQPAKKPVQEKRGPRMLGRATIEGKEAIIEKYKNDTRRWVLTCHKESAPWRTFVFAGWIKAPHPFIDEYGRARMVFGPDLEADYIPMEAINTTIGARPLLGDVESLLDLVEKAALDNHELVPLETCDKCGIFKEGKADQPLEHPLYCPKCARKLGLIKRKSPTRKKKEEPTEEKK